jgi:DNA-binding XRE family transcriptional regulator
MSRSIRLPDQLRQRSLPFPGRRAFDGRVQDSPTISSALAEVGPRVRRMRTQRDITLTALAEATGISKSTLSRLESGGRRPSLELLLSRCRCRSTS